MGRVEISRATRWPDLAMMSSSKVAGVVAGDLAADDVASGGEEVGGDEVGEFHAEGFVDGEARDAFGRLVDRGQASLQVVRVDHVGGVFEQLAVLLLRRPPRLFAASALRGFPEDREAGNHTPRVIDDRTVVTLEVTLLPRLRQAEPPLLRDESPALEHADRIQLVSGFPQEWEHLHYAPAQRRFLRYTEDPLHG